MRVIDDITNFIFIEHEPAEADIIFIPGGSYPELMEEAAGLWRLGLAPLLLPSGKYGIKAGRFAGVKSMSGKYKGPYETECDFYVDVALQCGVPGSSLITEREATYTMQNACFSRKAADSLGLTVRKALLCCKTYHARRAYMYYQYAFPETEIIIIPVAINGITRDNWYEDSTGIKRVMGELMRCGSQFSELIPDFREL